MTTQTPNNETAYLAVQKRLLAVPKTWLVTGVAGFIGSNLLEKLLKLNQFVVGFDNFSTGHHRNLDDVKNAVTEEQWRRFSFVEGDVRNFETCQQIFNTSQSPSKEPIDFVLHQAALGSVPRSIENPIATNQNNIDGFLNIITAARDANVKRFVYAASSSTYGDHPDLPKVEDKIGKPLSPYAVTKLVNELYADVFARTYGIETVGLRYFNVFGPRQDPNGAYAAVIPRWIAAMMKNDPVYINGDGQTSRDFCYVDNAVQANILAATADIPKSPETSTISQVYNVAYSGRTSLTELFSGIKKSLEAIYPNTQISDPILRDFRAGDVRHSQADISKAKTQLGYAPSHDVLAGLHETVGWYVESSAAKPQENDTTQKTQKSND